MSDSNTDREIGEAWNMGRPAHLIHHSPPAYSSGSRASVEAIEFCKRYFDERGNPLPPDTEYSYTNLVGGAGDMEETPSVELPE